MVGTTCRWRGLLGLACLTAAPRAFAAGADEPIRLEYAAPAECPGRSEFVAEVRRVLPNLQITENDETARLFTVTLDPAAGYRGRLTVTKDGATLGAREVDPHEQCDEVARVLALAVALAVDPNAQPPLSPPSPPPEPSPAPQQEPTSPPPSPSPPAGLTNRWWAASIHGLIGLGVSPNTNWGGGLSVDLGADYRAISPALRIGLEYGTSAPALVDDAHVRFEDAIAILEPCPTTWTVGPLSARPCLRIEGGVRIATGSDIPGARSVPRPWFAAGLSAHLRLRIAGPFFADASAALVFPIVRDHVILTPNIHVHQVPDYGGRGDFAIGVQFR